MKIEMKSDIDSEIQKLMPNVAPLQSRLDQVFDDIMEHKVVRTDMKLRHIYAKLWEVWLYIISIENSIHYIHNFVLMMFIPVCSLILQAYLIWMDKIASDVPYLQTLRENIPELVIPSMPERVFMNT